MGFTSLPLNDHNHFQIKLTKLFNTIKIPKSSSDLLYKPVFYQLFGDYDLLTLALVDDTEFALRAFTPYNPGFGNNETPPFDHQVLLSLGIKNPSFPLDKGLLRIVDTSPVVSVIRIKLSTYLLAGYGARFKIAVINQLRNSLSHQNIENWILSETFSWNELTLVIFNGDYAPVFSFLQEIRGISVAAIKDSLDAKRYKNFELVKDMHPIIKNTHTTFGYNPENNSFENVPVMPITSILTKGNSVHDVYDHLTTLEVVNKKLNIFYGVGNTDLILIPKSDATLTLGDMNTILNSNGEKNSNQNIINIHTLIVGAKEGTSYGYNVNNEDAYKQDFLHSFLIPQNDINSVLQRMKQKGIGKIYRDGILNILAEYNCGVQDPYLYGYFLDFKPFLDNLLRFFDSDVSYKNEDRDSYIEKVMKKFSIAFNNRFLQSFIMNDITDNNIFFKGGIQNLISGYSVVQATICDVIGLTPRIVYAHGHSAIVSTRIGIGLNYIQLMQPLLVIHHIIYESIIQRVREILSSEQNENSKNITIQLNSIKSELEYDLGEKNSAEINNYSHSSEVKLGSSTLNSTHEITISLPSQEDKYAIADLLAIDDEFLQHVIADYIVYYTLFNKNLDLMHYIYWGIFASNPEDFSELNKYDHGTLVQFLTRLLLLQTLTDNVPRGDIARCFVYEDSGSNAIDKYIRLSNLKSESPILSDTVETKTKAFLTNFCNNLFIHQNPDFMIKTEQELEVIFEEIVKSNTENIAPGKKPSDLCRNYFSMIIYYFNDYAQNFYKYDQSQKSVLLRDDKGEPLLTDLETKNPLLFDQMGGYYIHQTETKNEFLRLRRELFEKLLELSYEKRFELIRELRVKPK